MTSKSLLSYINPLEYLRTEKVIYSNPTLPPERKEEIQPIYTVYEYSEKHCENLQLGKVEDSFTYMDSGSNTWINVDGLNEKEVEILCVKYNIHPLIVEDILY